jgi:hypothetical protein
MVVCSAAILTMTQHVIVTSTGRNAKGVLLMKGNLNGLILSVLNLIFPIGTNILATALLA